MCGIVGYIGKNKNPSIGLDALKRLEYRGYDSAGMCYYNAKTKKIAAHKATGRVSALEAKLAKSKLNGAPFIFHTRWATHGIPNNTNAHPHYDCGKKIYVVHNGIVENHAQIKRWLKQKGHKFYSDTDTETLPHLIEHFYNGDLFEAVQKALQKVKGTYGIAAIAADNPNQMVAARLGSPLLVGVADGGYFVCSDPAGILPYTNKVIYLKDGELVNFTNDTFNIVSEGVSQKNPDIKTLDWDIEEAQKGGYDHFMFKEIREQPRSIEDTFRGRLVPEEGNVKLGGLEDVKNKLKDIKKLHIIACGTAYYSALVGKYMIEEYAGVPCEVDLGSEFRYRKPVFGKKDAALFISQSGETADTIAPLKEAKNKGVLTLGIVNVVGSTIARETDAGIYNHAGPEIGVASTKAFTSQLTALAMLTVFLGRQRDMSLVMGQRIVKEIEKLPQYAVSAMANPRKIKEMTEKYKNSKNLLYLGRKYNYPIALEGALKLKEISYIHAEGYAGGEMKHGPIALIDKNFPSFAIVPRDSVYEKMASNIEEIKARGGPIIAITTQNNNEVKKWADDVIFVPKTLEMLSPIVNVIPLQLFAYYVSVAKGVDPDKPRNLAKSVTVE